MRRGGQDQVKLRGGWIVASFAALAASATAGESATKTHNVVLVTTDGLRPEEVFTGADEALLNKKDGGVADVDGLRREFWRPTAEARREALLPFVWGKIAREGQLFGNAVKGSAARVTNGKNFSYPGYNELLAGFADPRIDSNAKRPNPNATVLEWLNAKPSYRGRVTAFTSWDVFPFILNRDRSGLLVNAGWEPIVEPTGPEALLNRLMAGTFHVWENSRYDGITAEAAMEHLRTKKPRVLYISLGETDEFAHEGRYDHYLHAAHRFDAFLARLWQALQADAEYRDRTSLLISTDHGRGPAPEGWKHHGAKVEGAEKIWIGVIGPDTPALGERAEIGPVTQSQVAATLAAFLGEDYRAEVPKAAEPIRDVLAPLER